MQLPDRQFPMVSAGDTSFLWSSDLPHYVWMMPPPAVTDSSVISLEGTFLQSYGFSPFFLGIGMPSDCFEEYLSGDFTAPAAKGIISVTVAPVCDVSDFISFSGGGNTLQNDNMYLCIDVLNRMPPENLCLAVDIDYMASFWVTVTGMCLSAGNWPHSANLMISPALRRTEITLGAGRMICIMNSQLNL